MVFRPDVPILRLVGVQGLGDEVMVVTRQSKAKADFFVLHQVEDEFVALLRIGPWIEPGIKVAGVEPALKFGAVS